MPRAKTTQLNGCRFLVLEDEPLIAFDISSEIERHGGEVVLEARNVGEALDAIANRNVDAAVLDFQLRDGNCLPVARLLKTKRIPFAFCTGGMDEETARDEYPDVPIHSKPCNWQAVLAQFSALAPC